MPKPELTISADLAGLHNANLQQTSSRLIKGGSWKRQRVIVILPAGGPDAAPQGIPPKVALAHWSLAFPPNNGVVRLLAEGMEVGEAYSTTLEQILVHPDLKSWEYLLTIEHDNAPPADGVLRLIDRMEQHKQFAAIGGLYFTKGPEGVAQIWGDPTDPIVNFRPQPPDPNGGLVECCGTGMGFTLFRLKMFHDTQLRRPWFKTQKDQGGVATQDLYFWGDARKHGYRAAIDCSVKVGHYSFPDNVMW